MSNKSVAKVLGGRLNRRVGYRSQLILDKDLKNVDFTEHNTGTLLTIKALCRMLDVTHSTVYNWRSKEYLPFIHLDGGGKPPIRFDQGAIFEWMRRTERSVVYKDYLQFM